MSKYPQPTLISPEDEDLLSITWLIQKGYYRATINKHNKMLHKLIQERMGFEGYCDHINQNKLDNRRENLRPATSTQNHYNVGKRKDNSSGYKGVGWKKDKQQWQARIQIENKRKHLGYYNTKEEAAAVL